MASGIELLNKATPGLEQVALGTKTDALITLVNQLRASFLILTAQLDADGGITDTDYAANADPTAAAVTVLPT